MHECDFKVHHVVLSSLNTQSNVELLWSLRLVRLSKMFTPDWKRYIIDSVSMFIKQFKDMFLYTIFQYTSFTRFIKLQPNHTNIRFV